MSSILVPENEITKVRCYFNLHKKLFSVQKMTPKGWRVWKHLDKISLVAASFKVSEAGRQRVIKEQKKNVHAFIEGDLVWGVGVSIYGEPEPVSYNPYKHPQFYLAGYEKYMPILRAGIIQGTIINNRPQLNAFV